MKGEINTHGGAGLKGTGYSDLVTTDMSIKLDELFGFNYFEKWSGYVRKIQDKTLKAKDIDEPLIFLYSKEILAVKQRPILGISGEIKIPVSREVDYNLRSARSFMIACAESEKVVDFFSDLARKVGFFFALPYDDVVRANNGLNVNDIKEAIKEGYAITGITTYVTVKPLKLLEITDKFCPLEKRV